MRLDLRLCRRARQGQGSLDSGAVLEANDLADPPKALQRDWREVEHADAMAVHA
jgi:hypothetical protein